MYESAVRLFRIESTGIKLLGTFRGSIMPNDMNVKGHILPGCYELHLGFHQRKGRVPTVGDLIVKDRGALRPSLVVAQDRAVPVKSNDPNKTTSTTIHIHNGFNTERGSDGCQTIAPPDWARFITHFLDAHPKLEEWHQDNSYRGRRIGVLVVSE